MCCLTLSADFLFLTIQIFSLISMRSQKTNHINILCSLGKLGEQRASLARTRRLKVGLKARAFDQKIF